jgi:hypothetical protein
MSTENNHASYDQIVVNIGLEWLTQYARFLRRSPELLENFADRPGEFELIPIPRMLLDRLAVPGMVGSGNLGGVDSQAQRLLDFDLGAISGNRAAPPLEPVFDCVREFAAALDAGDASRAAALFSPRFIDQDGRSGAEVQQTLDLLFARTSNRRFQVSTVAEVHTSEAECVVHVNAAWRASDAAQGAEAISERVKLEMVLGRQSGGNWSISGLRSL